MLWPFGNRIPVYAQQAFDIRLRHDPLTGQDEYRCYILDEAGQVRIICNIMADSPERAEGQGMLTMRLAGLADQYHVRRDAVRIGRIAELPMARPPQPSPETRIADCVAWAARLSPPWVKVLDYLDLGAERPNEIAILMEAALVPEPERTALVRAVRAQVPAHLLMRCFFISAAERAELEHLMYIRVLPVFKHSRERLNSLLDWLETLNEFTADWLDEKTF